MNLFLRFFYHVFISFFSKALTINEIDEITLRVWPQDLDTNIHMNNGVYLSVMDLGRTRFSVRSGLFKQCLKNKWGFGMVGGVSITYLKSIAPFQKFTLKTKLAGHYDGWIYLEQRFEVKGKLMAVALVKVIFLKKKKRVSPEEILEVMGSENLPTNTEYLEHLYNSEKDFLAYAKRN